MAIATSAPPALPPAGPVRRGVLALGGGVRPSSCLNCSVILRPDGSPLLAPTRTYGVEARMRWTPSRAERFARRASRHARSASALRDLLGGVNAGQSDRALIGHRLRRRPHLAWRSQVCGVSPGPRRAGARQTHPSRRLLAPHGHRELPEAGGSAFLPRRRGGLHPSPPRPVLLHLRAGARRVGAGASQRDRSTGRPHLAA